MPKAKNIATVGTLTEKLQKAKSLVLTDYSGLTHKQLEDLHKALKKVGAEFVVVKNSLLTIASKGSDFNLEASYPTGPTAALIAYEDEISPVKELYKFIKTFQLPKVKMGIINSTVYEGVQIAKLAALPGKDVLRAQVVSGISSPLYGLAYSLNSNLQKLVYVLGQIKK